MTKFILADKPITEDNKYRQAQKKILTTRMYKVSAADVQIYASINTNL